MGQNNLRARPNKSEEALCGEYPTPQSTRRIYRRRILIMALIKQSAKGDLTTHGRKLFGELCTGMD
jgi:hypothetical protein